MRKRSSTGVLEAWYSRITLEDIRKIFGGDAEVSGRIKKKIAEARKQTSEHVFHRLTASSKRGLPRIVSDSA